MSARHLVSRPTTQDVAPQIAAASGGARVLAYGCGRSYGDTPLNPGGRLIDCRGLDRFVAFNKKTGRLTCEPGVRIADILAVVCRPEPDKGGWCRLCPAHAS
jgi:FAD/FMN-containing dehydrogenase